MWCHLQPGLQRSISSCSEMQDLCVPLQLLGGLVGLSKATEGFGIQEQELMPAIIMRQHLGMVIRKEATFPFLSPQTAWLSHPNHFPPALMT